MEFDRTKKRRFRVRCKSIFQYNVHGEQVIFYEDKGIQNQSIIIVLSQFSSHFGKNVHTKKFIFLFLNITWEPLVKVFEYACILKFLFPAIDTYFQAEHLL